MICSTGGAHHPVLYTATSEKTRSVATSWPKVSIRSWYWFPVMARTGSRPSGVVEAVQEVEGAGAGCQAHPELPVTGITGHERGGLLVAHLDEADLVLARARPP